MSKQDQWNSLLAIADNLRYESWKIHAKGDHFAAGRIAALGLKIFIVVAEMKESNKSKEPDDSCGLYCVECLAKTDQFYKAYIDTGLCKNCAKRMSI